MLVAPHVLAFLARTLGGLPPNDVLGAYTIYGLDGSPYLTRVRGPRIGGRRWIAHRIWRPDAERVPHNHPWRTARFRVLSGGYVEERLDVASGRRTTRRLGVGDVNVLSCDDFHRIVEVLPETCTLGTVGEKLPDWGFWVDGEGLVDRETYQARMGYRPSAWEGRRS